MEAVYHRLQNEQDMPKRKRSIHENHVVEYLPKNLERKLSIPGLGARICHIDS